MSGYVFRIVIVFFIFSSHSSLSQECQFSGIVVLEGDTVCHNCFVQLLDSNGEKVLAFTTTDSNGFYAIQSTHLGKAKLSLSQFGYTNQVVNVNCEDSSSKLDTIQLSFLNVELNEISIVDQVAIIRKINDTTIFNTSYLSTGSELSASDIIEKIPGMEFIGSKILYKGNLIDDILLESRDISDFDQKSLTDIIHFQNIEDIRIVENYNKDQNPYLDSTEMGLMLNINLKDESIKKAQITIENSLGISERYKSTQSLIKLFNKKSLRIYNKATNANNQFHDFEKESYINEQIDAILFNNKFLIFKRNVEIPYGNSDLSNPYSERGFITKIFGESVSSKFGTFHTKNNLSIVNSSYNSQTNNIFYPSLSILTRKIDQSIMLSTFQSSNRYSNSVGKKGHLKIHIPIDAVKKKNLSTIKGLYDSNPINSIEKNSVIRYSLVPNFKYHQYFSNNFVLSLFGRFFITNNILGNNINSEENIIGPSYLSFDEKYFATQASKYKRRASNNQLRIQKKSKILEFTYNASHNFDFETLTISSDLDYPTPYIGINKLKYSSFDHAARMLLDVGKYKFYTTVTQGFLSIKSFNDIDFLNKIRPTFFLMYRINRTWNLSTSYREIIELPSLGKVTSLSFISDQFTSASGLLLPSSIAKSKTINLSLFRDFQSGENTIQFNSTIGYSPIHEYFQNIFLSTDNGFRKVRWDALKDGRKWNGMLSFSIFYRFVEIKTRLNGFYERFTSIQNLSSSSYSLNAFFSAKTRLSKKLHLHADYTPSIGSNRFNNELFASTSHRYRINLSYNMQNFKSILYYGLYKRSSSVNMITYHNLNYEFSYNDIKRKIEWTLNLNDILNLNGAIQTTSILEQTSSNVLEFVNQGGQIMLGCKWFVSLGHDKFH